jgi:hypothetical protein
MIEAEADSLTDVLSMLGLKLEESVKPETAGKPGKADEADSSDEPTRRDRSAG